MQICDVISVVIGNYWYITSCCRSCKFGNFEKYLNLNLCWKIGIHSIYIRKWFIEGALSHTDFIFSKFRELLVILATFKTFDSIFKDNVTFGKTVQNSSSHTGSVPSRIRLSFAEKVDILSIWSHCLVFHRSNRLSF